MDTGLSEVRNAFSRYLYVEDDTFIDVGLAAVVSLRFPGDPVWFFLVGSSGSGKSEFLRSLNGDMIHHLSGLTSHTFVSGLNQPNKKDPSMLAALDGKVIVVKDLTAILSENQKERSKIFGQLRDIYDGSTARAYGSGVGTRSYTCHVGFLAGVTPAIERYQTIDQVLGERFLNYRLRYADPGKAVEAAMRNAGRQAEMREELGGRVRAFLSREWPKTTDAVTISKDDQEKIRHLAESLAWFRTGVPKNRSGNIQYMPETEIATRLVVQLTKLGCGLAIIQGKSAYDENEFDILLRVARDSLPSIRERLLSSMHAHAEVDTGFQPTTEVARDVGLPTGSTNVALDDLHVLGIVEKKGSNPYSWKLTKTTRFLLNHTGLLLPNKKLQPSVVPFPGGARESM